MPLTTRWRTSTLCLAICSTWAGVARAQSPVTLHGVAYDSLRRVPLRDAFITLAGSSRAATSDSLGRFHFDSVRPGNYLLTMQHEALDSVGLHGASVRAVVKDGQDTVTISVPSFASLWQAACLGTKPPSDSGLLFGTIRRTGGAQPAAGATIEASWVDVGLDKSKRLSQRRWRLEAATDSLGGYGLCGLPITNGVRVQATMGSDATGLIDLLPRSERVQRLDLRLGAATGVDASARGAIAGTLTTDGDVPVPLARVVTDGVPEVRSGPDGRFLIANVPVGTRQIEVMAIGRTPATAVVDVTANDTVTVALELQKLTQLGPVRVVASSVRQRLAQDFTERRAGGLGKYRDSTDIRRHVTVLSIFSEFPSVTERKGALLLPGRMGGLCAANVWLDGQRTEQTDVKFLLPEDIAAIEVYARFMETPSEFQVRRGSCGSIVVWTKRFFP
jgi:hypothetical protein